MIDKTSDIIGNENIMQSVSSMIKSKRLAHAFLLYGDKGLGKKKIAQYIAMQIMCEKQTGVPCLECKACKMIAHNQHPDLKWIVHNTQEKGFSVKNIREIISEAYIKPNDSEYKIFIFADCDNMLPASQNTLLKIIEEPPADAVFIFTATSKAVFLPTILSRVISLGVSEVSEDSCVAYLKALSYDETKIAEAVNAFGGNIGMCIEYMSGEELCEDVKITKAITDSIINKSEYNLLKNFCLLDGKKDRAKTVLYLLSNIIRDCSISRIGCNSFIGCYRQGSAKLAQSLTQIQSQQIYQIIISSSLKLDGNANLSLTMTSLCAAIKQIY